MSKMNFITNAEMSINILKHIMEKEGKPLTKKQENYFMERYAKTLDFIDNDFDDSLGLPRLTEIRDNKEPPCAK